MGFFDERILAALKDGKPRGFTAFLGEVGFTHNTLQQHLNWLAARGLVVKEKMASSSLGRPKFAYRVPSTAAKQVLLRELLAFKHNSLTLSGLSGNYSKK
jgi:predicted ArsR family transcriptional regulator